MAGPLAQRSNRHSFCVLEHRESLNGPGRPCSQTSTCCDRVSGEPSSQRSMWNVGVCREGRVPWRLGLLGQEAVIITYFRVCFSIEQKGLFQNAVSSWCFCPNPLEMCVPSGEAGTRAAAPQGSGRHTVE